MDATLAKAIFFGLVAVGAGVAVGAAAAGGGVGFGASARGMMEGLARNPNLENKLRLYFFIGFRGNRYPLRFAHSVNSTLHRCSLRKSRLLSLSSFKLFSL